MIGFLTNKKGAIGVINLDATLSESHSRSAQVTEHPVEGGAVVSDHIIADPAEITINGVVTNSPIYLLASLTAPSPLSNSLAPTSNRAQAAYDEIKRIHQQSELIEIVTGFETYTDMAITSVGITRDVNSGNILNISVTAKEVTLVQTTGLSTDIPDPATASNLPIKAAGKVATSAATAANALKAANVVSGAIMGANILRKEDR